ncbi:unnamed protein product [Aureobasidium mustum]|uniref:DUF7492 domain-containing protein n=1 Tax=Aureobasidium mustum TaxID=2773714 RepID=A0A9N8PJE7_9PEZI|nr:unnamed protein product [Aureobasidium mustum]
MKFSTSAAVIAAVLGQASAHSWIEEMQVIDSSTGNYTGDYGYTRGYVARTDPGFSGDSVDYLVPALSSGRTRIDGTDLLCHPDQRTSNYTNSKYPRLQAAPGSYIAMKYLENGHVTLPQNQPGKPKSGGTVFVYATTKPSDTEKIADVLEWNTAGNGGDSRGTQIAAQNFDDGRCHQLNSGTISLQRQKAFPDRIAGQPDSNIEQWCETDVHIPSTYKTGDTVTVYWVWQWPTEAGVDPTYPTGKDEYYTSCAEIDIVDSVNNASPVHTLQQQDPQTTAVSSFKSRAALTTSPLYTLAGGASASATAASGSASSSTASSSASSSAVPSNTSTAPSSEFTDLPVISLPPFPFANTSSPTPGPTYKPSHASGNPSFPFFSPPAAQMPSFVTVTDYITMSGVANKAQGAAPTPKTTTQFVTEYVTASASTVVVPAVSEGSLPSVVAVPDQAGNAGLIGRRFVA